MGDLKAWEPHMVAVYQLLPKEAQKVLRAHGHIGMAEIVRMPASVAATAAGICT